MKNVISICLRLSSEQKLKLDQLNDQFRLACNFLFPIISQTGCWNRVGLHHLGYKLLREKFPDLGSQMTCNAIYSVSRTCRHLFQNPESKSFIPKNFSGKLPQIKFGGSCPVFFDKHTVSLKNGVISLYTMDGRIRFKVDLTEDKQKRFMTEKIKEIVLLFKKDDYWLNFDFEGEGLPDLVSEMPEYVFIGNKSDEIVQIKS
jgi:hypothetical protein